MFWLRNNENNFQIHTLIPGGPISNFSPLNVHFILHTQIFSDIRARRGCFCTVKRSNFLIRKITAMKQSVSYPIWFYVSYVNVSCALLGGCFILFHREMFPECAVDVVKFLTPVSCKKGPDKRRRRSSLIRVVPVCYSDKHFVNSSSENHHTI